MQTLDQCLNRAGQFQPRLVTTEMKEYLEGRTQFLSSEASLKQRFYCIRDGIQAIPTCAQCHGDTSWEPFRNKFLETCSHRCASDLQKGQRGRARAGNRKTFKPIVGDSLTDILSSLTSVSGSANGNLTNDRHMSPEQIAVIEQATAKFPPEWTLQSRVIVLLHDKKVEDLKCAKCQSIIPVCLAADLKKTFCSTACSNADLDKITKTKSACMERYGVSSNLVHGVVSRDTQILLENGIVGELIANGMSVQQISDHLGLSFSCVSVLANKWSEKTGHRINRRNLSSVQLAVEQHLTDNGIEFKSSDRTSIAPFEIDILIGKVGIEINGIYWHSDRYKDATYHVMKTDKAEEAGLHLYQFFEHEVNDRFPIVMSMITKDTGAAVGARKCQIADLDMATYLDFVKRNHIQGAIASSHRAGLIYNGEIVCVMGLGNSRFNRNYDMELHRFCNALGTRVVGGFSKLLKHLHRQGSLISYADRRFTHRDENVYAKCGFSIENITKPGYFYVDNNMQVVSRYKAQKKKLPRLLKYFDPTKSEIENMRQNNYHRIWDAGQLVYIKEQP